MIGLIVESVVAVRVSDLAGMALLRVDVVVESEAGLRVSDVDLAADVPDDGLRCLGQIGGEGAEEAHRPELQGIAQAVVVAPIVRQPLTIRVVEMEETRQLLRRGLFSVASILGTVGLGEELNGHSSTPFVRSGRAPAVSDSRRICTPVKGDDPANGGDPTSLSQVPVPKLPEPRFWQPEDNSTYFAGANVMLLAASYDLEDGGIPESSVAWYSSLDGQIATGHHANVTTLSLGTHTLEFRATDSLGAPASAFATVNITSAP